MFVRSKPPAKKLERKILTYRKLKTCIRDRSARRIQGGRSERPGSLTLSQRGTPTAAVAVALRFEIVSVDADAVDLLQLSRQSELLVVGFSIDVHEAAQV